MKIIVLQGINQGNAVIIIILWSLINSVVRGHRLYKEIRNLYVGEELQCKMEHGNIHNIAICHFSNRENVVVGHLPRSISMPCLWKGGIRVISCVVNYGS